jgi:hypothetical protein
MAASFTINRAPVLTLWAAVVAERLGYERDAALTLGRAVAGLNAQTKARRLGIARPADARTAVKRAEVRRAAHAKVVELLGRHVPVVKTPEGLRAAADGRPDTPESVVRYLESKFGEHLAAARAAMAALARSVPKDELNERAFALYEAFRPDTPAGRKGWGAKGVLDLGRLARLAGDA